MAVFKPNKKCPKYQLKAMSSENEFTRSLEITSVPSTYFKQQSTEEVDA